MDTFINSLVQILIEWGIPGLFVSALLAGSIIPFSSELILVALVEIGLNPISCVIVAALGNTAGGMICYYMGRCGKIEWIEKYFKIKKERINRMENFLKNKGASMAFFTFLPFAGEVISLTLGFMRSNIWLTTVSMFIGRLVRYIVILLALKGVINLIV